MSILRNWKGGKESLKRKENRVDTNERSESVDAVLKKEVTSTKLKVPSSSFEKMFEIDGYRGTEASETFSSPPQENRAEILNEKIDFGSLFGSLDVSDEGELSLEEDEEDVFISNFSHEPEDDIRTERRRHIRTTFQKKKEEEDVIFENKRKKKSEVSQEDQSPPCPGSSQNLYDDESFIVSPPSIGVEEEDLILLKLKEGSMSKDDITRNKSICKILIEKKRRRVEKFRNREFDLTQKLESVRRRRLDEERKTDELETIQEGIEKKLVGLKRKRRQEGVGEEIFGEKEKNPAKKRKLD